jgi:hypothetical protein
MYGDLLQKKNKVNNIREFLFPLRSMGLQLKQPQSTHLHLLPKLRMQNFVT